MPNKRIHVYPDPSELTIVIRGAHERTEKLCAHLIGKQLPSQSQLTVIHSSPFSKAVKETFEIGIDSTRPWLIAIDADIIPLDDAFVRIREICGKMAPNAFVATPLFLCQGIGGLATRGLHCYNAQYLQEAYSLIDTLEDNLRPESRIHDAMVARGYTRECYAKVFGLHEFEQSYKHLYLKAMLRCRKDEYRDQIRSNLESRASTNKDCQVMLWGFEDALTAVQSSGIHHPVEYDWNAAYPKFTRRMQAMSWDEKPTLDSSSFHGYTTEKINAHDYLGDTQTLPWIRELLDFDRGAKSALDYVNSTPKLETQTENVQPIDGVV
tara:strand:+ start:569198 stop:570166 length:969 start_codon:yes stop_codon:yes gene_type:complete